MSGSSVIPAGSKRMPVKVSTYARSGTPYCRPWLTEMAKASMMPASVEPCLETRTKISPGRPSSYSPTVTKPLQSATRNSKVRDARGSGSSLANRLVTTVGRPVGVEPTAAVALGGDGLAVALLGHATAAGPPCSCRDRWRRALTPIFQASMWSCSMSSTVVSSGMLTVLEMAPEMNGCTAAIILTWPDVVDRRCRPSSRRTPAVCSAAGAGRRAMRLVLVDVGDDGVDLRRRVAERGAGRPGHRLVDDRHGAAADQLLGLDQAEIGLDAGGVAVHQETDGAGGRQHRGLGVAHADLLGQLTRVVPRLLGGVEQLGRRPAPRRCRQRPRGACRGPAACAPRSSA